jgi:hypothetical protein
MAGTIKNLIIMNLLYWLPTIHWPTHKTPSREGNKPTKTPRRFHQSRTKTTIAGMVIVTLAFTAHLCHGEKLSAQRCATLRSVTKASCSKPPSNQVVLHTPLFAMMVIKTARCWPHSRTHSHPKTFEDKQTTQKRPTSSDELQVQSWSLKRWANIHKEQAITKKGIATSSEVRYIPCQQHQDQIRKTACGHMSGTSYTSHLMAGNQRL